MPRTKTKSRSTKAPPTKSRPAYPMTAARQVWEALAQRTVAPHPEHQEFSAYAETGHWITSLYVSTVNKALFERGLWTPGRDTWVLVALDDEGHVKAAVAVPSDPESGQAIPRDFSSLARVLGVCEVVVGMRRDDRHLELDALARQRIRDIRTALQSADVELLDVIVMAAKGDSISLEKSGLLNALLDNA